jgi:hypothetical protein
LPRNFTSAYSRVRKSPPLDLTLIRKIQASLFVIACLVRLNVTPRSGEEFTERKTFDQTVIGVCYAILIRFGLHFVIISHKQQDWALLI